MNWNDLWLIYSRITEFIVRTSYCVLITALTAELAMAGLLIVRKQLDQLGAYPLLDRLGRIVTLLYFIPVVYFLFKFHSVSLTSGYTLGIMRERGEKIFGSSGNIWVVSLAFLAVWLVGAIVSLARMGYRRGKIRKWLRTSYSAQADLQAKLDRFRRESGIRRRVRLKRCYCIGSPMARGIIRPSIVISDGDYREDELRVVFAHELTHIRRRDVWFRLLAETAECLFWFCPLVHQLPALVIQWSETCTDICAGKLSGGTKQYFTVINLLVSKNPGPVNHVVCMVGEDGIEERVTRMRTYQKGKKRKGRNLILTGICSAAVLASSMTALAAGKGVAVLSDATYQAADREGIVEAVDAEINGTGDYAAADPRVNDGQEYTAGPIPSDANVIIQNPIEEYYSTYKSLGWTVPANYISETPIFRGTDGGYIRISMEVKPADVTVYIGIIEPDLQRRYCIVTGDIDHRFTLTKTGGYQIYVENISQTTDIQVVGGYFFE